MSQTGGALVVATGPGATEVVGGLPLALRAVLALRAAGVTEPWVFAGPVRRRLEAAFDRRGVPVRWIGSPDDLPAAGSAIPVASPGRDLLLIVPGDHLVDAAGVLRAPTCDAGAARDLVEDVAAGRPLAEALRRAGSSPEPRSGAGLFVPFGASPSPRTLETRLLDSLARHTVTGDSYMATLLDRRLSRPVTRWLLGWTGLSPSMVTLASVAAGLIGAAGLGTTGYPIRLAGVLCLVASIVLDCVDGEIARARFEQSAAGARLDVVGDYVVNLAVFVGLGTGLVRQGLPPSGPWAAAVLVGGVAAAMLAMHRLFVQPALRTGGDLHWEGDRDSLRGTPMAAAVEKVASRDYTYLLLGLALVGHLEWFLYAAAAGSWLFAGGLVAYAMIRRGQSPSRPAAAPRQEGAGG